MVFKKILTLGTAIAAIFSATSALSTENKNSPGSKTSGYYEISIYELEPEQIDATGQVRAAAIKKAIDARSSEQQLIESPALRALQDQKLKSIKEKMSQPVILPNADIKTRLDDIEKIAPKTSSRSKTPEDAYTIPELSTLANCKLESKSSDRLLSSGKYGSTSKFYSCENGDVFINRHALQQMRIVFIKELINAKLNNGINGGITNQKDNKGNTYTSLRWATNNVFHTLELSGHGDAVEARAKSIDNEIIAKEGA